MKWKIAIPVAASVAVVIAFGVAAGIALTRDHRQDIDLGEIANRNIVAFDGMHRNTHALCDGIAGCIQGYSADHAEFLRFASTTDAARFAKENRGAYQSHWIVIRYPDDVLTSDQREEIQWWMDHLATSDGDAEDAGTVAAQ
ncbi:MAG: hypothetical protein J0J05_11690 [Microbacterium sp.]|uniref:hypothetical protein n=1 Tax=Microbacterium sp. TaxID=51671 RepID=UPI001AC7E2E1|nr:hypothetical protein [Microbacterium sp.]MBN9154635.1 hypothetical protein [Microbacterium sp.]